MSPSPAPFATWLAQLADPDPQVRQAAVKALGQLGDARARPALLALLTNQKQSARLRLAAASAGASRSAPSSASFAHRSPRPKRPGPQGSGQRVDPPERSERRCCLDSSSQRSKQPDPCESN